MIITLKSYSVIIMLKSDSVIIMLKSHSVMCDDFLTECGTETQILS